MKNKTIKEEIPLTKEGLLIYQRGIQKELYKIEEDYKTIVRKLNNVLELVNAHLERMNNSK